MIFNCIAGGIQMKLLEEFKKFAMKGNVFELATGVVIGTAFSKVVNSVVGDIIMPLLGLVIGKINFADLKIVFAEKTAAGQRLTLNYGSFLQTMLDFLCISASIFAAVKIASEIRKKIERREVEAPKPAIIPTKTDILLEEIRDLLKTK
jgi:large conductance mechanosensitive channel